MADTGDLKVITGVRFTAQNLKQLNAVTFLFDPNWETGVGEVATLPISIFYTKSISEIYDTDVSQKQLIFHNSTSGIDKSAISNAQTAIIADNILIKPKTYKLQILVPIGSTTIMQANYLNAYQHQSIYSFLATGKTVTGFTIGASAGAAAMELLKLLIGLLDDVFFARATAFGGTGYLKELFTNITEAPSYNKDSLEAMWRNRSILKMKTWDGWRYKYVVIKSLELAKEGTVNGLVEGSLTVQEMPIMTVRPRAGRRVSKWVGNPIVQGAGWLIKKIINGAEAKE